MLLAPSTMNSLLPFLVPLIDMVEGEEVSKGRMYEALCGVKITPGERVARTSTIPSLVGRSAIAWLSITCPMEAVEVSKIGASVRTWTLCDASPTSIWTSIVIRSLSRTAMP